MKSTFAKRFAHASPARKAQWLARKRRRIEAEARQVAWDKYSLEEKVEIIKGRRGESKKELARLMARFEGGSV